MPNIKRRLPLFKKSDTSTKIRELESTEEKGTPKYMQMESGINQKSILFFLKNKTHLLNSGPHSQATWPWCPDSGGIKDFLPKSLG